MIFFNIIVMTSLKIKVENKKWELSHSMFELNNNNHSLIYVTLQLSVF